VIAVVSAPEMLISSISLHITGREMTMDGMTFTETGTDASERIWPEASALVYDDAVKARTDHLYEA
jgi:hypothetical protein